jgi:hypothetical protein
MADGVNDEVVEGDGVVAPEGNKEGVQAPTQHEYSDVEQRAMAQGWVPEDQYTGHGKWRSADDFLDRGELFAKIDEQNRRLKTQEETAQQFKKHLERVRKTEYNRALATLRAEKKSALIEGDADAVVDVDEKIETLKAEFQQEEQAAARQVPQEAPPNPVILAWMNRNPWYNTERAMKIFADEVGTELAAKGMLNPKEILDEVERRTKKEFAHKFTNPNRSKAGAVEGGGGKGSTQRDSFQLTDEETRAMNRFVKAGLMTKEEYIADIRADRGV